MGEIIACMSFYFFIEKLKPRYIEIIELIFSIIEIIFLIWGLLNNSYIPWKDIRKGAKIFYIIMLILICINFIIIIVLIYLRCSNKINTTKNDIGIYLCITTIVLVILSKILLLIDEVIIAYDMYYKDNNDYSVIIPFIITELSLAFQCYCSCFLIRLIYAKTDLNDEQYQKNLNKDSSSINGVGNRNNRNNPNEANIIDENKQNIPENQPSLNSTTLVDIHNTNNNENFFPQ